MIGNIAAIILFVSYIICVAVGITFEIKEAIKRDKELKKIRDKYNNKY